MSPQTQQPWADTPFQLLTIPGLGKKRDELKDTEFIAQDMANAHNNLLRSLNSIYNQAPFISSPKDIRDFLQYSKFWCLWITEHHNGEENLLFPWLEEAAGEKGLMEANVSQHLAFMGRLEQFESYLKKVKVEDYDGQEMRRLIDSFGEIFTKHLREEIDTLLELEQYGDRKWKEIYERFVKEFQKNGQLELFPLVLGASDNSVMPWPDLPAFVPYLCYLVFQWKHAGAWRFSPSTVFGQRRPLAFTAKQD